MSIFAQKWSLATECSSLYGGVAKEQGASQVLIGLKSRENYIKKLITMWADQGQGCRWEQKEL